MLNTTYCSCVQTVIQWCCEYVIRTTGEYSDALVVTVARRFTFLVGGLTNRGHASTPTHLDNVPRYKRRTIILVWNSLEYLAKAGGLRLKAKCAEIQ